MSPSEDPAGSPAGASIEAARAERQHEPENGRSDPSAKRSANPQCEATREVEREPAREAQREPAAGQVG